MVYVAVSAAVLMGMVGLALDSSRAMITHSEAQAAADAAALAAASQLDGTDTAISRATAAAESTPLVTNTQRFAVSTPGPTTVTIVGMRFLTSLPASDSSPIGSAYVTSDATKARFVEVTTQQLTHTNGLLKLVSDASTTQIQRKAVAGFREVFCKIPPLMICNPQEASDPNFAAPPIGAEVQAKLQGAGAAWGPGNYGLLQPPNCTGASCVQAQLAATAPNFCVPHQINVQPGDEAGPSRKGMNVRFGLYESPVSMASDTAPDINITQTFTRKNGAGNCYQTPPNPNSATSNIPFPDDASFNSARLGNGVWNCLSYWTANHTGAAPAGCTAASSAPNTRYAMYQREQTAGGGSRFGTSACAVPGLSERRVLYVAVINCTANGVTGSANNVPVVAFLKALLLHPVAQGPNAEMDIEILGTVRPGTNNQVVKDEVQLYR